jgi:hypothetical protein
MLPKVPRRGVNGCHKVMTKKIVNRVMSENDPESVDI